MGEGERGRRVDVASWLRRRTAAMVLTCVGVGAAILHVLAPSLKIDGVTVMLLAVAAVPWLGHLFRSIELPGIGRIEFRDIERRIEAVQRTANAALVGDGPVNGAVDDTAAWDRVEELAAEYVDVRREPRGRARTQRMDQIFARLVHATQRVRAFDTGAMLDSENDGLRLAAYARLYALPDPELLGALVDTVTTEPLPFSQYWGLQAIERGVQDAETERVPLGVVRRLHECRSRLPYAADRVELIDRTLARLGEG